MLMFVEILKLMLGRDSEDETWSRFMFELVIWPQVVTLIRWTQLSGPLCLWQCFVFLYQKKIWVQDVKAIISLGPQLSPDFRLGEAIGFCEQDKAACFQILFAFIAKGSPLTRMRGGCVGTQLDRMWRLVEFCFKKDICFCEQYISSSAIWF